MACTPFFLFCQTTLHQIASHCYKYLSKHMADIRFWFVPRILRCERQVYLTGPRGEWSPMLLGLGGGHSLSDPETAGSHAAHIVAWLITIATVDGLTLLKTPTVCASNWSWHNILSCSGLAKIQKWKQDWIQFLMTLTGILWQCI